MGEPDKWIIFRDGRQYGPLSLQEFSKFVQLGQLKDDDYIWYEGLEGWLTGIDYRAKHLEIPRNRHEKAAPTGQPPSKVDSVERQKSWFNARNIFWAVIVLAAIGAIVAEPNSIPYRLTGAINGAIFGAVGGAVGGVLAAICEFVMRRHVSAKFASMGILLGFIAAQALEQGVGQIGDQFYNSTVKPHVEQVIAAKQLDEYPIYQAINRIDPSAYSAFRSDVSRRIAAGASGNEISQFTENYTATFRRANADYALAATPKALSTIIRSMQELLDYLHNRDIGLCADYVLQAFASPKIRALAREPSFSKLLQTNALAVFSAIEDGRKHNSNYRPLADADVDLAVAALTALGWSDEMRDALASPETLRSLPKEQVCKLHREWFTALSSLRDEGAKVRWYREILSPLFRS